MPQPSAPPLCSLLAPYIGGEAEQRAAADLYEFLLAWLMAILAILPRLIVGVVWVHLQFFACSIVADFVGLLLVGNCIGTVKAFVSWVRSRPRGKQQQQQQLTEDQRVLMLVRRVLEEERKKAFAEKEKEGKEDSKKK